MLLIFEEKSSDDRTNITRYGGFFWRSEVGKKRWSGRPRLEYFLQIMKDVGLREVKERHGTEPSGDECCVKPIFEPILAHSGLIQVINVFV